MVPWGGILRFLTMTVVPLLGRRLNDPNIVNKMSNSVLMRAAARLAVRVKLKYEEVTEEDREARLKGDENQQDQGGSKKRTSRVKSRTYYEQTAEKLKKRKR